MPKITEKTSNVFKVECPYCQQVFEAETEFKASLKEGQHRTNEHIEPGQSVERAVSKGNSIVDDWKKQSA